MKIKRLISVLIALTMILCIFTSCGKDDGPLNYGEGEYEEYKYEFRDLSSPKYIEPAAAFAGGDGSESDPYQISSASELSLMQSVLIDENKNDYDKAYYVLTADIELNDTADFNNWKTVAPEFSWKPIVFNGMFDGNNHTVSGLYINQNCEKDDSTHFGLFGKTDAIIKNLNIEKSYIAVSGYSNFVGSVAGSAQAVENCASDSVIDCYDTTCGGIVGTSVDTVNSKFSGEINQIKEKSMNYIGGVVGTAGNVKNCTNEGVINFGANDVDSVGGIVGRADDGVIENCTNNGSINGKFSDETALAIAGGIIGKSFLMVTGKEENWSKGISVKNCTNNGTVSAHNYAGGICGEVNNDHNPYCVVLENCVNNSEVKAKVYTGGIIGSLTCNAKVSGNNNVLVKNCINNADLNTGTVGGVIGMFISKVGQTTITDCKNSADLTSTVQNCAGILGYWAMGSERNALIYVDNCKNSGNITSPLNAGGIFSYADAPVSLSDDGACMIKVSNCSNSGDITTKSNNSYIGGISGNWGMKGISSEFVSCTNSGKLIIDNPADPQGYTDENGAGIMTISRIAGGIIGRVGEGLLLTTDSDNVNDKYINNKKAVITLKECSSTGSLFVTDSKEYTDNNGEKVYKNYFGGIVGNTTGEKEASIFVENCTYSNFERGLGNTDLKDIGSKM